MSESTLPIIVSVFHDGRQYAIGYEPKGTDFDREVGRILGQQVEGTINDLIAGVKPKVPEITLTELPISYLKTDPTTGRTDTSGCQSPVCEYPFCAQRGDPHCHEYMDHYGLRRKSKDATNA